ncbi:PolC-type DNA polymerase III [Pseudomonas sp. RIT623]|uniref:3'-5' exonuclease n=1 Tax=Pseudomonas sp. RIT623 TaxID=2559075 RepID=UPI00106F13CE|nr:3'-5' exonuclease [Pseudomonas sp. RIT623]TFF42396.1 3'-5' exonuclease [Pseudomonas sp. RIT623]
MKLFAWLRQPMPELAAPLRQRLARLPRPAPAAVCSLREQRWVVLDLETSGLNPNRDQVLSIGAVAIEDGAIDLGRPFERTLHRPEQKTNASVLIHGLGPSALAAGCDPAEALLELLEFIGDSPVLAFHAPFDQRMLERAVKGSLGLRLQHAFLDVADLAPMLNPDTVLREAGLDDWIARFGLEVQARHHASADAQVTAELALILFSQARRQQLDSPLQLRQRLGQWQRRKVQQHSF